MNASEPQKQTDSANPRVSPTTETKFRFLDLFSGIGGFHHALEALGGECVLAADIDPVCRQVYKTSWPNLSDKALIGDVRALTLKPDGTDRSASEIAERVPDHEVLCAGFPCQPFSKSGQQLGLLDQTRGTLFFDIMAIVRAKLPRYVILENVKNLAGPRHAETFKVIVASLREAGYKISSKPLIISPHALPPELGGTPQHRERVFLLAEYAFAANTTRDLQVRIDHRAIEDWDPQNWNLDDILVPDSEIKNLEKFKLSEEDNAALVAWNEFVQGIPVDNLPGFPIWADCFETKTNFPSDTPAWKVDFITKNNAFYEVHKSFIDVWLNKSWIDGRTYRVQDFTASKRKFEWQARKSQALAKQRDLWKLAIQFRPSGIRVKALTYLPTLVAITQTSFIGPRRRFLTPLEAGRMQGFPDRVFELANIDNKNAYKQAGNAVHVGVARFLASELFGQTQAPWLQN